MTKSASLYSQNLEDQKVLFLYGAPAEIGDFTNHGVKLFAEKAVGNVCGCIGFVRDRNTKLNVPNTLLKKDIRDVTEFPMQKVYAVISKNYSEEKYSVLRKIDSGIDMKKYSFPKEIEKIITWENL